MDRTKAKLTYTQPIHGSELTIGDFWRWAYSDILSNRNRAVFAEYLVGAALGVTDQIRIEWNAYDFQYQNKKIEVKASAYLQSWAQKQLSRISFDIGEKRSWDEATNSSASSPLRSADCYVFCLFTSQELETANVLDVTQWKFYVVLTMNLTQHISMQKRIGLNRLQSLCNPVNFSALRESIDSVLFG